VCRQPRGQPISYSDRPLLWKLSPDPAHPERARFHLVLPDGSPADEATLISSGRSPLYLVGETVFPGPAPLPQPETQIPVAVARDPKVTRALLARGVQFSESFEIRVRQVPMRARLECWLSQNAANNCFPWPETLLVCLTAHSDDPPYSEVWTTRAGSRTAALLWRTVPHPMVQFCNSTAQSETRPQPRSPALASRPGRCSVPGSAA